MMNVRLSQPEASPSPAPLTGKPLHRVGHKAPQKHRIPVHHNTSRINLRGTRSRTHLPVTIPAVTCNDLDPQDHLLKNRGRACIGKLCLIHSRCDPATIYFYFHVPFRKTRDTLSTVSPLIAMLNPYPLA